MKKSIRVFIASSSERLEVAEALCAHLKAARTAKLAPSPWSRGTFESSATYIESLEKELGRADYAVFVLTPDDAASIREQDYRIPRDNVLFEAGLFMGRLDRKRCYLVHASDAHGKGATKLPSDLLGVKTVSYPTKGIGSLDLALKDACRSIVHSIVAREDEKHSSYCGRAAGAWWEFIRAAAGNELSFLRIIPDSSYRNVQLVGGEHFNGDGDVIGNWNSTVVGVRPSGNEILYGWEGSHPHGWTGEKLARGTDASPLVTGFGKMTFVDVPGAFERGSGGFIDLNPSQPAGAEWKYTELARIADEESVRKMLDGSRGEKKALVKRVLRASEKPPGRG